MFIEVAEDITGKNKKRFMLNNQIEQQRLYEYVHKLMRENKIYYVLDLNIDWADYDRYTDIEDVIYTINIVKQFSYFKYSLFKKMAKEQIESPVDIANRLKHTNFYLKKCS